MANDADSQGPRVLKAEIQAARKRFRIVERDLAGKDHALVETEALLVLWKKLRVVWGVNDCPISVRG